jgi:hypothetical protein
MLDRSAVLVAISQTFRSVLSGDKSYIIVWIPLSDVIDSFMLMLE